MKLLWLAVVSTALRASLVLSQDESTTDIFDVAPEPTFEPTPEPTIEPSPEIPPEPTPEPDPAGEPATEPAPVPEPEPIPEPSPPEDYNVIPHIPEGCSDIRVFSIRGSNEPYPGRGGTMLGVICQEFEATGLTCDYEDVVYPANISYSGIFCESAHTGAYAGQAQMTGYIQKCPDSRIVLMGYSQGGSVVGDILGGGGGSLFGCEQAWNPPLPRSTAPGSSIVAVLTFGAPRSTANQPYNIGKGSTFDGVLGRHGQQLADLNAYKDIYTDWCNAGDPVCAVGSEPVNITAHWSYYDEYTQTASRWIVAKALGEDSQIDSDGNLVSSGSNSSANGTGKTGGGGDEDGAFSLRSQPGGGLGGLVIVALFTTALGALL